MAVRASAGTGTLSAACDGRGSALLPDRLPDPGRRGLIRVLREDGGVGVMLPTSVNHARNRVLEPHTPAKRTAASPPQLLNRAQFVNPWLVSSSNAST